MQRWRKDLASAAAEGEGGASGGSSAAIYTPPCVKETAGGELPNSTGGPAPRSVMT